MLYLLDTADAAAIGRLVDYFPVAGVTTNPAIFHKAIAGGRYYEDELAALKKTPLSAEARYEALVIPDVQQACDLACQTGVAQPIDDQIHPQ